MTWTETHQRTRIIRRVEAAAAVDMTGALPWREEWREHFGSPEGLVAALRARWNRMCEAQLDACAGEDELDDTYFRLRRTQAGVLAILQQATPPGAPIRTVADRRSTPGRRRPVVRFRGGSVLG